MKGLVHGLQALCRAFLKRDHKDKDKNIITVTVLRLQNKVQTESTKDLGATKNVGQFVNNKGNMFFIIILFCLLLLLLSYFAFHSFLCLACTQAVGWSKKPEFVMRSPSWIRAARSEPG